MAAAITAGRQLDRELQMKQRDKIHSTKKKAYFVDPDGNKIMLTEEN